MASTFAYPGYASPSAEHQAGHRADCTSWLGLAVTLLAHLAAVALLLTYTPARDALKAAMPLMVSLIHADVPAPAPPEPKIKRLPKPLPVKRSQPQAPVEQPVVAAQTAAPTAVQVPPPPKPQPAPPVEALPAPLAPVVLPNYYVDYLHNPAPIYPPLSRRMGEEGRVLIRVFVEPDGQASKVELRSGSGSERLDQSALDAVRRWKFVPARQGERAVAAWVVVPVVFNLKG